jgi:hypothetical protein
MVMVHLARLDAYNARLYPDKASTATATPSLDEQSMP